MDVKQQSDSSEERRADVFISHSRKDKDFVRHLAQMLEKSDHKTWVDVDSITPTAEFWPEVYSGIEGSDAFIFVISPDSVGSEDCQEELAHAVRNNKRLVPIVYRGVGDEAVPKPLRSPQWIFFRNSDDFDDSFQDLVDALDTDLEWLQEHTRLLTRAIEWDQSGRKSSSVLRGSELRTAEGWQVRAADKEPKLTTLQSEYVLASRREERRRQWLTLGAVTFGLIITAVLGVFACSQRNQAIDQRNKAERQASIALGRQLAAQAQLSADQKPQPLQRSVLLALEARKQSPLHSLEADQILRDALTLLPRHVTRFSYEEDVSKVAFSPDGKYLATASARTVRVSELSSHDEVRRWLHEPASVVSMSFSPDGERLYVVSSDNTVRVWNVGSGEAISDMASTFEGGEQPLTLDDARFSPNGQYLYAVSGDDTVRVWDPSSGEEVARIEGGANVAFSQYGKYVATSGDGTVRVFDMSSREEVARIGVEGGADVGLVGLSPEGKYLATLENPESGTTSTARVWETISGEEVTRVTQVAPAGTTMVGITGAVLGPGGRYVANVNSDRTVSTWDTASGKEIARITHEDDIRHMITDVAFSPDGGYLATTSADETIRVWDLSNDDEVARIEGASGVTFSPEGEHFAAQSSDGTVGVWETLGGKLVARLTQSSITTLAFSPDGEHLAIASGNTVRVWEATSGEEVARMSHDDSVEDVTFSPDGRYLATASFDRTARVWSVSSGEEVTRLVHDNDPYMDGSVEDIAFSPDGKYLATASDDRTVRLWDPNSGDEVARMNHDDGVKMLAFGPHGKYMASVSGRLPMIRESGESFTAHIWNLGSGEELARMTHNNIINMVAFSPDGRYLATASDDQTARVWEVPSGEEVARVTHDDSVQDVAFSPDGRYLTTESSGTARARLWRQPEDLSKEACSRLTRNFTEEEWQLYMDGRPYHKTCTELPKPTV